MKLFTLKRFFVVTLLMCLGISQGWAARTFYGRIKLESNIEGAGLLSVNANAGQEHVWETSPSLTLPGKTATNIGWAVNIDFYLSAKPTEDYEFMGWSENKNATSGDGKEIDYKYTLYSQGSQSNPTTKTFYAIFKKKIDYSATVTVDVVGGEGGNVNVSVRGENPNPENPTISLQKDKGAKDKDFNFTLNATESNGYQFVGWRKGSSETIVSSNKTYNVTLTCTYGNANVSEAYHAVFAPIYYSTVTVQSNSTENGRVCVYKAATGRPNYSHTSDNIDNLEQEHTYYLYAEPMDEGCEFIGWYGNAEFTGDKLDVNNNEYKVTAGRYGNTTDITLYAKFVRNYSINAMAVMQSSDAPNKSYYKIADTAPNSGSASAFLISSTNKTLTFGNSTTAVGMTLSNDEYTGEVNINGKPYTFVFESGRKIKCSNGQYLDANVTGWTGSSRTASLSLANSSSTTWNIEKTDEGGYTVYHTDSYWGTNTKFYLSAPSSAGGQFTLAKNDATKTVQILNGIVKDLEFYIKADYATVYCEDAYEMPSGLTGYFVKGAAEEGAYLKLEDKYHSGEIVPACTALLIEGPIQKETPYKAVKYVENAGTKKAKVYTDADENQLEGTRVNGLTHSKYEDTHPGEVLYYKLSYGHSGTEYADVFGFWWGTADGSAFTLKNPYTAYLALVKGQNTNQAHGFSLPMGDDDTLSSIEIIESVDSAYESDAVYTISGMRVNDSKNLPAGVYIRNGKKFMVR